MNDRLAGLGDGADGPTDPDDLDLLDPVWTPPRRAGRLTVLLAAGLIAALGFAGGVLVQKNHDAGLSGGGSAARNFARANGFGAVPGGAGASRGSGGAPSGAASSSGGEADADRGTDSAGSAGSSSGADAGRPVVVGTVVSVASSTLVVRNFAGTTVTVQVPAGTPVTAAGLTGLRAGMTVSVAGTKTADGAVTATSVVSRSKG